MLMSTMKRFRLLARVTFFAFSQSLYLPNGMAQSLHKNKTMSSPIAFVSSTDALAYNNSIKLVRSQEGYIHLVFHDQGEVFYSISTDNGISWNIPLNVSNTAGLSVFPALAVDSANRKHFVWQDDSNPTNPNFVDGKKRIWYKNFIDVASNSSRYPIPIGEAVGDVLTPSLAVQDERTLIATWSAFMGLSIGWEINFSIGTLIGNGLLNLYDWTYPSIPGRDMGIGSSFFPAIATLGGVSYLAWREYNALLENICIFKYNRSTSWSLPQLLNVATVPHITSEYDIPTVILSQDTTAFFGFGADISAQIPINDVFVTSHRDEDSLEARDGVNVSNSVERDLSANFTISLNNELVIVWQALKNDFGMIYFSKAQLDDYDKTWSAPLCVSNESANARNPQVVAITPDTLLFVWLQGDSTPFEIIAKRYPPLITKVEIVEETISGSRLPISAKIYPNPLGDNTNFEITLNHSGLFSTKIYNIRGQLVKSFAEQRASSGIFRYSWDTKDNGGLSVPNGVYVVVFQLGSNRTTKRFVVLKR